MLIQCREDMFHKIREIMSPLTPQIRDLPGVGHIDTFDKGWVFMYIRKKQYPKQFTAINKLLSNDDTSSFMFAFNKQNKIVQQNLNENEQYIFLRGNSKTGYEILHGWSSYVTFEVENDTEKK